MSEQILPHSNPGQPIPFKAETRQLLDILIHSLYTEREVFLRELVSNASDALTRMNFEMLTQRDIVDPEVELAIWISADAEKNTLTIRDTGLGMTAEELAENLGTIAHSGARAFLEAAQQGETRLSDIIGQFGVGFYSAFMVAESITVVSRSYRPDAQAAIWTSTGANTFTIEPGDQAERGTTITLTLKSDASEFAQEHRLRQIIQKHSDFIPYPIYLGTEAQQANRREAIWRQMPRQIEEQQYHDFYKQLTLEPETPLTYLHLAIDAPVQMYALLYVPASSERSFLSLRNKEGLKLYARKVLIQEYCQELLPDYLRFLQGVVDSEDLPLNVSRESIQSTRVMAQLKKLLTAKTIDHLKNVAAQKAETYEQLWETFGRFIKEGVATDAEQYENLLPLLRFHSLNAPECWIGLEEYVHNMKDGQNKIYYILGEDERAILHSPHLELVRQQGYDVLLFTDPMDSFVLLRLTQYQDHPLGNVATEDIPRPSATEETSTDQAPAISSEDQALLVARFKTRLGDRVSDVRTTDRLIESPARLVDKEGSPNPEIQRVYRLLNRENEAPEKVLEINPQHAILRRLASLPEDHALQELIIEQVYEDALLIEGIHPNPASMIARIQKLMQAALE